MRPRALVVVTPAAASGRETGARLRAEDVRAVLQQAGYDITETTVENLHQQGGGWELGVAVSYASAAAVRLLRRMTDAVWLDAVDSWLLVNGSGLRAGHPSYALRAVRDGSRLACAPAVDLITYISETDLRSDRNLVRGRRRLVLPPCAFMARRPLPTVNERRLVLAGDWNYPPNRDGLRWLVRHVLPLLREPVHIYGDGRVTLKSRWLLRHGYVEDPQDLLRFGDVHLAPIRFGAGIKRKVLQPLLAGLPVVTTPLGANGLRSHPLLDLAHTPSDFSAAAQRRLMSSADPAPVPPAQLWDRDDTAAVLDWLRHPHPWAEP
jgi:hypothetical protein